ncbi:MAG: NPCBM/NEW2 domain-containing protein [Candidatus Sumerlaeota bacterium]|nr:NPCBM/NEW2 domain-containing protein [Candidatus Sumerlaeota bacterium]
MQGIEDFKKSIFRSFPLTTLLVLMAMPLLGRAAETVWLTELDLSKMHQGWEKPQINKSVDGNPITLGGQKYERGVGTHAASTLILNLGGGAEKFSAVVGVDEEKKNSAASVEFRLIGDGKALWKSGIMKGKTEPKKVEVDLKGVQTLILLVADGGDGIDSDHADWAEAKFILAEGAKRPVAMDAPREEPYILTPKPSPKSRINGARVFGVRPGAPFLYAIPVTGDRPMEFAANGLPQGLALDAKTGRITGALKEKGEHTVTLHAKNALGEATLKFKIVCGDKIALTPPLGWNSWNCFAGAVDDAKVRSAADAMVASGLVNHGWTYINLDDCWSIKPNDPNLGGQPRDANGMILTNKKFPDMKAMCDYIHSKGLKAGIYSSPGPLTCAGFTASYKFEDKDAQRLGEWGFDYIKYDWCSYDQVKASNDLDEYQKPYQVMRAALDKVNRDIVYSLCQYGMGGVWEWGDKIGGNCWRTTGDITDSWESMAGIGFAQAGKEKWAGPGHWNDPDMLVVGKVGWGDPHPTKLTPSEQYTHISLWCLLCSPLLIGCDMAQLDDFTLNLLTNDEVLEVNQDPLGKQAARISQNDDIEVWAKDMEDGSKAVGIFNRGELEAKAMVKWSDLKMEGKQSVRDLWRQKDLGEIENQFEVALPRHGAALFKLKVAR